MQAMEEAFSPPSVSLENIRRLAERQSILQEQRICELSEAVDAAAAAANSQENLDFIVLNSLNDEGAGFQHDTNKITLIDATESQSFPLKSKTEAAKDIINRLKQIMA